MSRIAKAAAVTAVAGAALAASAGVAAADSGAQAIAAGSPGAISGNLLQVPVHIPVNLCGNSFGAGLMNPTFGNTCVNVDGKGKHTAGKPYHASKHHGPQKHGKRW
jgi:hypothetical protein